MTPRRESLFLYSCVCLLAELAQQHTPSIVFDYGQGFSLDALPPEFLDTTNPVELQASRDGIDINPLQIFPSDMHGPVNVAQRVADTFARVYPKIGVQQHAVLRQAVLDVMADEGIVPDDIDSWGRDLPAFKTLQRKLLSYASNPNNPQSRFAASVASHISTLFVFNTFRSNGQKLAWPEMMEASGRVFIVQLKGLEYSLERAVTEFLLWNLIGYVEALGPSPLRCFIVLDEAHKLSFDQGSPVEKLLREGRKFGLGLILASQQPEDFSPVAFANTATKIVFQVGDEKSTIARQLQTSKAEVYDKSNLGRRLNWSMRKEALLPSSTVRFLHSVGQSTLQQGITVPLSAQVSWLANIKKGESVPVTIVFDKNRSVPASLRRLNNLLGHLQFRYGSRQQAPLRDYLCAIFSEGADSKNAILRIIELEPRTFLFQPVSAGYEKAAFLSLYKPYFHNFSEGDARRIAEFIELQQCFASIPYDDSYGQSEYNRQIAGTLRDAGWRSEARILREIGLRCDFEKNGIWLEVEFGNARAYYQDYVKFLLALRYANARLGVLLCPTNAFAQLLCDLGQRRAAAKKGIEIDRPPLYSGMMSYEKAMRELPFLEFILTGSVIIGGIEIQG